ncbi:polyketide cyclase [Sorangium cellulosum]|uniref:Polyketide cyclase n=1 Tax=Sorangium cellulosum TaxID=56 RepID=A0A2L0EVA0_SORCE|nr:SRPBCC family protein [Sorangium cellulosum]AUX43221.1 polyketide cyclase [Sorangium cellulosum]
MPTIQSTAEIDAPADDLFALTQDYGLRLEWDPFVRELRYCDGATEPAVGVRVWVRAKNGLSMEVRYITMNPPEQVAIALVEGPPIFRQFSGAWLFKALSARRTRVTFRYNFAARPRILAPVLEPVMTAVLRRDIEKRLAGLKRSAETTDILQRLPRRSPITA